MKTLKRILLAGLLAASGIEASPMMIYGDEKEIEPYSVETWYGENAGSVNGYYVKAAATMTFSNGNWNCRGWILESSSSAVTVTGTLMNPGSKIVEVYISINGVPTNKCIWVTVNSR